MTTQSNDLNVGLDEKAFALRPVRTLVENNEFRFYEGVTFPENPWRGCELWLRRCKVFGFLVPVGKETNLTIDILDEDGDVIQDYGITREGFEYLRGKLKFRVDR